MNKERLAMKKVVVTGGAGFIGSHLAEELEKEKYHVVIIDNLCTGRMENIERLIRKETVEFIEASISNLPLLRRLFSGATYVFHQAAIPSVPRSIDHPLASHKANITGTLNVLLAARDNEVKKVIYASSSSVYGETPMLPKKEDMAPNPQSPYAVTKLTGEHYCHAFKRVYGLPTVCLRYFNVYGPRQDPNSSYAAAIPRFIKRVSEGKPPIIFGDGKQTRDFTYIKDVIAANILAAEGEATGVCNIARGENVTINEVVRIVCKLINNFRYVEPIYKEPRVGDVKHSLADISKAKNFGYMPKYDLDRGLKETIEMWQASDIHQD